MQEVILKRLADYDPNDFEFKYTVGSTDVAKTIMAENVQLLLFECSTKLADHPHRIDIGISKKNNNLIARRDHEYFEVSSSITPELFKSIKRFSDRLKINRSGS